jgi:hypothetical protein
MTYSGSGHLGTLLPWIQTRYFYLVIEAVIAVLTLAVSFALSRLGSTTFSAAEGCLQRIAQKPWRSIVLVMLLALLGRAALLPVIGIPRASIHDEFSYLLAGQTFAAGRVTNQPHPMWVHFESVHILQQPTYMSMYQPGQALCLALGNKLAGNPWVGVWISTTIMCGAICWMLQAWLPAHWALAGGLLATVRWGIFSYWVNSYWGGALAATAGALVAGSLPRLVRHGRARHALSLGVGFVLLANTRPYEGLVFSGTACLAFAVWSAKRRRLHRMRKPGTVIPLVLILIAGALIMLYYNWRVTGDKWELPYFANRDQYAIAPLFLWQKLKPQPVYRSCSLKRVYLDEVRLYNLARSHLGLSEGTRKLKDFWLFYGGPLFTVPLLALWGGRSHRDERNRFLLIVLIIPLIAILGEVWFYAHYAAPCLCVTVALVLQGMRMLRQYSWRGRPVGIALVRWISFACVLLGLIPAGAALLHIQPNYWPMQWYGGTPNIVRPAWLTAGLAAGHRKALIVVSYSPNHDVGDEWVYNDPDIDRADIVWARTLGPARDQELIRYFHDRTVWLLRADHRPWRLTPYPRFSDR